MRSIFVHLKDVSEPEVAAYLTANYPPLVGPSCWMVEKDGDPVLYIDFYRDLHREAEVEEWLALVEHFGSEPSVSVVADVSGRHKGTEEARSFVCGLLQTFSGVAQDDYTEHLWTVEEIQDGVKVKDHPFFDYLGWYHAGQSA